MNKTQKELLKQLTKIKWIAVGTCPQCGKKLIRDVECDMAVCTCKSVSKVELTPVLILPPKLERFFEGYAKKFDATVDEVFFVMMYLGLKKVKKMGIVEFLAKRSEVRQ